MNRARRSKLWQLVDRFETTNFVFFHLGAALMRPAWWTRLQALDLLASMIMEARGKELRLLLRAFERRARPIVDAALFVASQQSTCAANAWPTTSPN